MIYLLTGVLLIFFVFAYMQPAHKLKNAGNTNPLIIDVIIEDAP